MLVYERNLQATAIYGFLLKYNRIYGGVFFYKFTKEKFNLRKELRIKRHKTPLFRQIPDIS